MKSLFRILRRLMDDTRERLLNAAGEVFAEKGYDVATVREICSRAEANVASVNYHFGDKERLYVEAVLRAHCEQEEQSSEPWPHNLPAEVQLKIFIERMLTDMLDQDSPSWHTELIMREMSRPTAACKEVVQSYISPKFELLMNILDQLLPEEMPTAEKRLFAFSVVGQCLLYRFHRPIGRLLVGEKAFQALFDVPLLTTHITEFTLKGIQGIQRATSRFQRLAVSQGGAE